MALADLTSSTSTSPLPWSTVSPCGFPNVPNDPRYGLVTAAPAGLATAVLAAATSAAAVSARRRVAALRRPGDDGRFTVSLLIAGRRGLRPAGLRRQTRDGQGRWWRAARRSS